MSTRNPGAPGEDKIRNVFAERLDQARQMREEEDKRKPKPFQFKLFPIDVYRELCKTVIGQDEAKKRMAVAACFHYRLVQALKDGQERIYKNSTLLVGPTGVGKTFILQKLAGIIGVPFHKVDMTGFSEAGYVGNKVESILEELVAKCKYDLTEAGRAIIFLDELDKIARRDSFGGRDVSGSGVQYGLLKIIEGGPHLIPAKGGMVELKTGHNFFAFAGAFSDLYERLRETKGGDARYTRANDGEILAVLQDDELIDALKGYGMIPELMGRITTVARLHDLTPEHLLKILTESAETPIIQIEREFKAYDITAKVTPEACKAIAERAHKLGTGARGLRTILERACLPFKFIFPGSGVDEVVIDHAAVENPEAEAENLAKRHAPKELLEELELKPARKADKKA